MSRGLIRGKMKFWPRYRTAGLRPGRRGGHSGRYAARGFREDTEVIDFFAPLRNDFLLGGKPASMSED